eukprot:g63926.t1
MLVLIAEFAELFSHVGPVVKAKLVRDAGSGVSRGYGFLTFKDAESAAAAVSAAQSMLLEGRKIDCKMALPTQSGGQHVRKLFVGGLSPDMSASTIQNHFSKFGEVVNSVIMIDKQKQPRGFGFVTFANTESITAALRPGITHEIDGRKLEVQKAVSRAQMEKTRRASSFHKGQQGHKSKQAGQKKGQKEKPGSAAGPRGSQGKAQGQAALLTEPELKQSPRFASSNTNAQSSLEQGNSLRQAAIVRQSLTEVDMGQYQGVRQPGIRRQEDMRHAARQPTQRHGSRQRATSYDAATAAQEQGLADPEAKQAQPHAQMAQEQFPPQCHAAVLVAQQGLLRAPAYWAGLAQHGPGPPPAQVVAYVYAGQEQAQVQGPARSYVPRRSQPRAVSAVYSAPYRPSQQPAHPQYIAYITPNQLEAAVHGQQQPEYLRNPQVQANHMAPYVYAAASSSSQQNPQYVVYTLPEQWDTEAFVLGNTSQLWELLRTAFDFPGMPPKQTAYLGLCAACGVGWRAIKSSSGHVSGCAIPEQSITEWQSLGLLPYRSQNLANSKLCKGCLLALPKIAAHAQKARMFRDSLATVLTSAVREKCLLEHKAAEASMWKASAEEATSSYHYLQEAYLSQRECKQLQKKYEDLENELKRLDKNSKQTIVRRTQKIQSLNQEAEQAQRDHAAELTALQDQNTQLVEEKTQLLEENTKLQQQTEDGDKLYSPTQSQDLSCSQGSDYIPTPLRATAGKKVSTSGKTTAYTYSPAVIRAAWGLLTADMPTSRVPEVLQLLLQCSPATAGADGETVPAIPTIIRWLHALGLCVTQLQTAYEIAQSESCTLHSDGTSKNLVKYYACPISRNRADGSVARVLPGGCYTQPSGTAEDSAKGIKSALEAAAEECRLADEYDESLFNLFGDIKACQLLAAPACYMSDNEAAAQATGKEWLDVQRAASSENELPDIERLRATCSIHSMCLCEDDFASSVSDWIKQQIGEAADLNEIIGKKDNIQCVALRELAKPVSGKENATDTAMRRKPLPCLFRACSPLFALHKPWLKYLDEECTVADDQAGQLDTKLTGYLNSAALIAGLQLHGRLFVTILQPHRVAVKSAVVGWHIWDAIPFLKKIRSLLLDWKDDGFPDKKFRYDVFNDFPAILPEVKSYREAHKVEIDLLEKHSFNIDVKEIEREGALLKKIRLHPQSQPF